MSEISGKRQSNIRDIGEEINKYQPNEACMVLAPNTDISDLPLYETEIWPNIP